MKLSTNLLLAAAGTGLAYWMLKRNGSRYRFEGRVIAIVGGSRGLGLEMARQLAGEGASVVLLGRSGESLRSAREDLERLTESASVLTIECDVTNSASVEVAFDEIESAFGRVDVLINNAGTILCAPFDNHKRSDFEEAIDTHLYGPISCIRAVLPMMRRQGEGRILNISSIGGKVGVPHMSAYSASKHALVGFSRALAAELRQENIRVTVACPGLMRTGSHGAAGFRGRQSEEFEWFAALSGAPGISAKASSAARKILSACRSGKPETIVPWRWWVAAMGDQLMPGLATGANGLFNEFLPAPEQGETEKQSGRVAGSGQEPESLERAAAALNQK
ncbi:SDR family oxidoreductase [Pelagicoccus sp. SDUM812002]|uniref:SDR family NAD(P)-dependent oxidoreductase n=1 Tax=Pelagicoccus sp. SDUM812002 TaxID=3041266 RepID=UPI00280E8CB6|nr:SDR family oxidoreductase [Pelagicoccus sp. SDUM812002]MDQ8184103.1 SDR family oxidoreductase [Pelagicoccus sp. SDUM812002]